MVLANANSSYYVGLSLGFLVVVVVVAIVAVILTYAARIAAQARVAADALEEVRASTAVLPELATTNEHALAILEGAKMARGALTG